MASVGAGRNGSAYLLLGDEEAADRVFAEAAATSAQPESQALALSERALLAARHDDDLAERWRSRPAG